MALALLPAWQKVRLQLGKQRTPTTSEIGLLTRIG